MPTATKTTKTAKKKPSPQISLPVKAIKPTPVQAKASAKPIVAAKKTQQPVLKASTKDQISTAKAPKNDISLVEAKPNKTLSKQAQLITLLQRPTGANINDLMEATGWQAHSIRGHISGTLRKRLLHKVVTLKFDGINHYRIESAK